MNWTDQLLAIAFVFLLLGVVFLLARRNGSFQLLNRFRRPSGPQMLSCAARLPLTAQHTIHLVELPGRTIVVATFPGGAAFEPQPAPFSTVLGNALGSAEAGQ